MSKLTTTSEHKCQHIYWYLHTFYLMSVHWKHFSYFQFIACILHFALWFVHNPLLYNYSNIINVYMPKCSLDIAISSALLSIKSINFCTTNICIFCILCTDFDIYWKFSEYRTQQIRILYQTRYLPWHIHLLSQCRGTKIVQSKIENIRVTILCVRLLCMMLWNPYE